MTKKKISNFTETKYIRRVSLKSTSSVRYYSTYVNKRNNNITSDTLNNLLVNQGVTNTDKEFDELKNKPTNLSISELTNLIS